ncbi:MAG: single-stranded DNA-binding protein [Clostridiales bacterium]|nr:single-stranded DNA-binding protein [Clostridiales bacterium]
MNKCILIGNLTKDPELTTTSNGVAVCRFSIAVSRRYSNSDGEREADFLNIVVWRGPGENCHKFLKKGSKVGIVGNIQSRSYDAADGTKRYVTEIVAEEVEFLTTRNSEDGGARPAAPSEDVAKLQPIDDDGLPF